MSEVINISADLQFKRGTASRWSELNPVLRAGEPGYVIDTNRIKIGDGSTEWNDLPYVGESSVVNANTHYDFPSIGRENTIYKAESEKLLYQWNSRDLIYEVLGSAGGEILDIDVINGGVAEGLLD